MFLKYNTQLGPPFHVLVDTNFVNFSIRNRIDMMKGFMDCLYAKGMLSNFATQKRIEDTNLAIFAKNILRMGNFVFFFS